MIDQEIEKTVITFGLELTPIKIKPWGFTIGIQEKSLQDFMRRFFPNLIMSNEQIGPRFIIVNPNSRLSWQKHERRKELWRVVRGPVGVMLNQTDDQPENYETVETGSFIEIKSQTRHRLIGLSEQSVVAEVWMHTDKKNPSDALDIVRISDDYER